jgi:putative Ca2+/H+ antiporter (TMEM165/GDT1 family)
VHPAVALAVFPVIFIGELPDKTMFASLVMASRGHPRAVWLGSAAAFLLHVVIAVTIGVGLFKLLPARALDLVVAALFLGGAVYSWREGTRDETELIAREVASHRRVATTAFVVIFLAEWGDLTQILIANLAAKYQEPFWVAIGSVAALWAVCGLAVTAGQGVLQRLPMRVVRRATAVILALLAAFSIWEAIHA